MRLTAGPFESSSTAVLQSTTAASETASFSLKRSIASKIATLHGNWCVGPPRLLIVEATGIAKI
jgi:hypothetical protein